jgi:hypothetical protein
MGQRMSAQKMLCLKQGDQRSQSGLMNKILFSRCVLFKPSPPILLPLTTPSRKPTTKGDLLEETQKKRKPHHLKTPVIEMGSERMDRPTVGTTVSLQTQCPLKIIKIPSHIPMAPQSRASASRTPWRPRPRVFLSHLLQELDIDIKIQYQRGMFWRDSWGLFSWQEFILGYPFSFPSAYSEKKKDLYNKR